MTITEMRKIVWMDDRARELQMLLNWMRTGGAREVLLVAIGDDTKSKKLPTLTLNEDLLRCILDDVKSTMVITADVDRTV